MSELAWEFPINLPQVYVKENPTSQTKRKMDMEMSSFVLSQELLVFPRDHRLVWLQSHPGETLTQDDIIHHINGNHDDNRPENLLKLTSASKHRLAHVELYRKEKEVYLNDRQH